MKLTGALLVAVLVLSGCATQSNSTYKQKSMPERIDAWNNVAREYIRLQQYEEAKRPLKQALTIDPKAANSLMLMAYVFQRQGESAIADDYYQQALKSAPADASVNNNYGIFLLTEQRYSEACQYLAKAANDPLYDQRTSALENLASCHVYAGDMDQAEQTYHQVLRLNPNSPNALIELGAIEYQRQQYGQSYQYFQQFSSLVRLRQAEHSAKSLYLGILLARENSDPAKAATYALLLKSMYPNSVEYQRYKESR
ncbi:type IV pilus biogenesis/stability protein PilW [Motiliproteus sp.]|uniref:type IV pilus biogenesis/stability protein PilW n=1 Tax=Motiliproteus sp. TaxID=1898955 RepID=UPI003BAA6113